MTPSIFFEELNPADLEKIIKDSGIIYLPLGSLEWHERHLPFGLDALVSYEICKSACKKTGGCVIPPLYFGTDREHNVKGKIFYGMDARAGKILPGSLYFLKQGLFFELLKQVCVNVSKQGFRKLIIVSAHSGTAQQNTLESLAKEKIGSLKILIFPGKLFEGGIDHAGKIETSFMLAINKKLVDLTKLKEPLGPITGENPKFASGEEGRKRIDKIVNAIKKRAGSFEKFLGLGSA